MLTALPNLLPIPEMGYRNCLWSLVWPLDELQLLSFLHWLHLLALEAAGRENGSRYKPRNHCWKMIPNMMHKKSLAPLQISRLLRNKKSKEGSAKWKTIQSVGGTHFFPLQDELIKPHVNNSLNDYLKGPHINVLIWSFHVGKDLNEGTLKDLFNFAQLKSLWLLTFLPFTPYILHSSSLQ